ncbi:LysR substrate-binding domain-containing protein [Lysobacter sp. FW306-1B-D06B]|uniref:LysR family transcriptional regulator n=1 Tax=Lysobacter sp. FW306-1B-D06B TaxID=3140250 RepID=UPI003140839F
METLANLESFVRSAELGGFSAAARQLGLTPAAISRNVALLEKNLGTRLFHRSTRKLTLTESGERLLLGIRDHLDGLQSAISGVAKDDGDPAGVLKVSVALAFGMEYLLPLLPEFMQRYPHVRIDWQFDNRQVDLVAEGFDAAIGGGFELSPGVVSRTLAPAHIIAVASPAYVKGRRKPTTPQDLSEMDGIVMRSARTGRVREWTLRDAAGHTQHAQLRHHLVLNDPAAMTRAAVLGLGVALIAVPDALPFMERGELVRLVPKWYADAGPISLYYASRTLMPAKTRVFVDHVVESFKARNLAERFAGSIG